MTVPAGVPRSYPRDAMAGGGDAAMPQKWSIAIGTRCGSRSSGAQSSCPEPALAPAGFFD